MESNGNKLIVAMNTSITAYSIQKELGYVNLRDYIYRHIPDKEFDSHTFTNAFPNHFPEYYERMLVANQDDDDMNRVRFMIANRMGMLLGRDSVALNLTRLV